jgi:hypothetical protein
MHIILIMRFLVIRLIVFIMVIMYIMLIILRIQVSINLGLANHVWQNKRTAIWLA